jgi:hypothetical protein
MIYQIQKLSVSHNHVSDPKFACQVGKGRGLGLVPHIGNTHEESDKLVGCKVLPAPQSGKHAVYHIPAEREIEVSGP